MDSSKAELVHNSLVKLFTTKYNKTSEINDDIEVIIKNIKKVYAKKNNEKIDYMGE